MRKTNKLLAALTLLLTLPALALAGSLALTVFLCFQPPMGAYADTDRFDPPAANESLSTAMSYIAYDPEADGGFQRMS